MPFYILHKGKTELKVPISKIFFVTTHPEKAHVALFITQEGEFETVMPLTKIEEISEGQLVRCHRKFLVNKSKIAGFNTESRTILFMDSSISNITCSRRQFSSLKNEWKLGKGGF